MCITIVWWPAMTYIAEMWYGPLGWQSLQRKFFVCLFSLQHEIPLEMHIEINSRKKIFWNSANNQKNSESVSAVPHPLLLSIRTERITCVDESGFILRAINEIQESSLPLSLKSPPHALPLFLFIRRFRFLRPWNPDDAGCVAAWNSMLQEATIKIASMQKQRKNKLRKNEKPFGKRVASCRLESCSAIDVSVRALCCRYLPRFIFYSFALIDERLRRMRAT